MTTGNSNVKGVKPQKSSVHGCESVTTCDSNVKGGLVFPVLSQPQQSSVHGSESQQTAEEFFSETDASREACSQVGCF